MISCPGNQRATSETVFTRKQEFYLGSTGLIRWPDWLGKHLRCLLGQAVFTPNNIASMTFWGPSVSIVGQSFGPKLFMSY